MINRMDLHVHSLTRMKGGFLYAGNKPHAITASGLVNYHVLSDGVKAYTLEVGNFIVSFKETIPVDIAEANFETSYYLIQPTLMDLGSFLHINLQPFTGFLQVGEQLNIEVGSRIATFVWKNQSDEEEIEV